MPAGHIERNVSILIAGCEETRDALSDVVDHELRGSRRVRVALHLVMCSRCRRMLDSVRRTVGALRDIRLRLEPEPALVAAVVQRVREDR